MGGAAYTLSRSCECTQEMCYKWRAIFLMPTVHAWHRRLHVRTRERMCAVPCDVFVLHFKMCSKIDAIYNKYIYKYSYETMLLSRIERIFIFNKCNGETCMRDVWLWTDTVTSAAEEVQRSCGSQTPLRSTLLFFPLASSGQFQSSTACYSAFLAASRPCLRAVLQFSP